MASTSTSPLSSTFTPTLPPFLRLPPSIRHHIYTYLLSPHPSESTTYINYVLGWPWFENPSNTTFNGALQLDLCRCPQNPHLPRKHNSRTEDHIYTRYKCYGPEVGFKRGSEDSWVPDERYGESGKINFLKPGRRWGRDEQAPCLGVLSVCRTVYREAVGVLYRGRKFCFLTGPCPRGRYQAYATQNFLSRLSPLARGGVTDLEIVALPYEEDAGVKEAREAYETLASHVQCNLPRFERLWVRVWDSRLRDALRGFEAVFRKEGLRIWIHGGEVGEVVCEDVGEFAGALRQLKEKELEVL